MKALVSFESGGPDTLKIAQLPYPVPKDDELLVRVAACGVNYPDTLVIEDRYQFKPARPFAPGSEIAGEVIAVGAGVIGWCVGDRMIGTMLGSGGMAGQAVVKANASFHLPDEFDFIAGSALLLTYGTAIHALKDRGRLGVGDTLLVLGAGGGVGLAAIQVGRALGARVIAAASSQDKLDAALEAGAETALLYPSEALDKAGMRALSDQFKHAVGSAGANVVLDPVGGDYTEPALRCIAWQGRYLVVGFPAGIPRIPLNLVLMKGCEIVGVFQGAFGERDPSANAANIAQLITWWGQGRIKPLIAQVFTLEDGGEAIDLMARRGAIGKLVIDLQT